MLSLGMDIGTSTVKLVLLKNQEIEKQWMAVHHGNPFVCLEKGLSTLEKQHGGSAGARFSHSLFRRYPSYRRGCALDHSAGRFDY